MTYSPELSERSFDVLSGDALRSLSLVNRSLEYIWSRRPLPVKSGFVVLSDGDLADSIHNLITNFGLFSALLFDNAPKRNSENQTTYRIRLDRLRRVNEALSDIDLEIFSNRNIRNRYMHSDEYLPKCLQKSPKASIIQDLALSHRDAFQSDDGLIYLRVFDYAENSLLHLGAEFDVSKLYETSLQIVDVLRTVEPSE